MGNLYRLFVLFLILGGLAVSILSGTDICTFGGCTEAHKYRLLGFAFPPLGIAYFILAGLTVSLMNRLPGASLLFNLLLAGGAGAEINMILFQKNVIHAWCPLCLAAAAIVYILAACQIARYFLYCKEESPMNLRSFAKLLLLFVTAMVGFTLTFSGIAKKEVEASQLILYMGKKESKLEVYFFSDWLCPYCSKVEASVESVYPSLSQKARFLFVDKIIHQEALNFVPYGLSFAVYEKSKYLQLRKALFAVAQKTKNPSYDDIKAAITPLNVTYRQLGFLEVTQQMGAFQKLAEQYKVTSTPTLIIRNAKTNKMQTLVGNVQITPEAIMKAVTELQ